MQMKSNAAQGGIISFDIDNVEAELPPEDGESHQLLLTRALSDEEAILLDFLNGEDCACYCEKGALEVDGEESDRAWIDCGPLSAAARGFLSALRH